jgi:trehalose 6-phosphate phosphatase
VHAEARAARGASEVACDELRRRLGNVDGTFVEGKGLTATIHYRLVEDAGYEDAVHEAVRSVTDEHANTLEIHDGKQVVELRPAIEWDKGRAVEWIRDTAYDDPTDVFSIYVGDDVSDEAAFRALNDDGVAVRVGDTVTAAAADLTLDDPEAITRLLARFADVASDT